MTKHILQQTDLTRLTVEVRGEGVVGYVVGLPGLEPGTSRLSGERSNQLSYRPSHRRYGSLGDGSCQGMIWREEG